MVYYLEKEGKYYAATGSKGFRWLEAEMVRELKRDKDIDKTYYQALVDGAKDAISLYGDAEWFTSDDEYIFDPKANEGKSCNRNSSGNYKDCPYWMGTGLECKLGYDCLPF